MLLLFGDTPEYICGLPLNYSLVLGTPITVTKANLFQGFSFFTLLPAEEKHELHMMSSQS